MRKILFACCAVLWCNWGSSVQADLINWTVDSSQSWARLTIPDQVIDFEGTALTVRFRDQNSTTQWTDGGGRLANLQGTLATHYDELGQSLSFIQGAQNLSAIQTTGSIAGQFRPNPAAWDPIAATYTDSSGAPAAFGARIRGTALIFNFDVGFLALRNVAIDAGGTSSLSGSGGNFVADSPTNFLLGTRSEVDLHGFSVLGNDIESLRGELVEMPLSILNSGDLTIENLGGSVRRMTKNFLIDLEIPLNDNVSVSGTIQGQIVAVVPEPASSAVIGLIVICGLMCQRRREVE